MKIFFKFLTIFFLIILFVLAALCIAALPMGQARKRLYYITNTSIISRLALRVFGVRVSVHGPKRKKMRQMNYLVVSNHLSYVDILVISSLMPSVFITSVELKHTFPLGLLACLGESVFVERRSPAGLKKEVREISRVLEQGLSVVLFPEGTTSNGEFVRPFKNSLLTAAIATGTGILPVCLRYRRINGQKVDSENRDSVFYYGGTKFLEHAPRLLSLHSVNVECIFLRPIKTRPRQSRKQLAALSHSVISAAYRARR